MGAVSLRQFDFLTFNHTQEVNGRTVDGQSVLQDNDPISGLPRASPDGENLHNVQHQGRKSVAGGDAP
jgi:hypothetical protein